MNLWLPGVGVVEWGEEIVKEVGIDMYTNKYIFLLKEDLNTYL